MLFETYSRKGAHNFSKMLCYTTLYSEYTYSLYSEYLIVFMKTISSWLSQETQISGDHLLYDELCLPKIHILKSLNVQYLRMRLCLDVGSLRRN